MSDLLQAIFKGWGWKIGKPVEVVATNQFGNALVKTETGSYFRVMPEEWQCELIATSTAELEAKRKTEDFIRDWEMSALVARAKAAHGPLAEGQVYYLVIPGLLGGKYSEENIRKISLQEVLSYCGDMAHQMEDVPDGTEVKIVLKE